MQPNPSEFTNDYHNQPQETPVTDTQELPAVAKLREAFDTARNALIDGSELAKQVAELRQSVSSLNSEVNELHRDLEYVRNRNKELDEQVTQVRQARDAAIGEAQRNDQRANQAEASLSDAQRRIEELERQLSGMYDRLDSAKKDRDDAEIKAMELEDQLKTAEAKLAKIEEAMHGVKSAEEPVKPLPHYTTQPRDEVGKFEPIYPQGSQSGSSGF
jgi:chromosome segregation ATPase